MPHFGYRFETPKKVRHQSSLFIALSSKSFLDSVLICERQIIEKRPSIATYDSFWFEVCDRLFHINLNEKGFWFKPCQNPRHREFFYVLLHGSTHYYHSIPRWLRWLKMPKLKLPERRSWSSLRRCYKKALLVNWVVANWNIFRRMGQPVFKKACDILYSQELRERMRRGTIQ